MKSLEKSVDEKASFDDLIKFARECCEASEVRLGKFLPARECYELTRECCSPLDLANKPEDELRKAGEV